MSYQDTIVGTWKNNHLFSVLVELTYRCNLDCFFCYNDLALRGEPLRLSDYERILREMSELGCLHLTLSGGEPLAHPDFFTIGQRARELGFVVRIKSNGHVLSGERLARLRTDVDPFIVEVSLHGASAETHDRQTRVSGSFDRLMQCLNEMQSIAMRFKINTTLTRWNEDEIEEMFEIADRCGVPLTIDPEVTPRDNGERDPLDISATPAGLRRLADVQAKRAGIDVRREGDTEPGAPSAGRHCGAGASGIAIDPYGNVYPCVQWRRAIGNVHESSLRSIWRSNRELDAIRDITVRARDVVRAHGQIAGTSLVGFCPGIAEALTGDPLEVPEPTATRSRVLTSLPLYPHP